jgi:hypothetical protein
LSLMRLDATRPDLQDRPPIPAGATLALAVTPLLERQRDDMDVDLPQQTAPPQPPSTDADMDGRNTRQRQAEPAVPPPGPADPCSILQAAPVAEPPPSGCPPNQHQVPCPITPAVPLPVRQPSAPIADQLPPASLAPAAPTPTRPPDGAAAEGYRTADAHAHPEPAVAAVSSQTVGGRWGSPHRATGPGRWSSPPAAAKRPPPPRPPEHTEDARPGTVIPLAGQPPTGSCGSSQPPGMGTPIPMPATTGARRPPTPPPPVPADALRSLLPAMAGSTTHGRDMPTPPIQAPRADGTDGHHGQLARVAPGPQHATSAPEEGPHTRPDLFQARGQRTETPTPAHPASDADAQISRRQPLDPSFAASPPGSMPPGRPDSVATALDTPVTPTLTATFPETILEGWPLTRAAT